MLRNLLMCANKQHSMIKFWSATQASLSLTGEDDTSAGSKHCVHECFYQIFPSKDVQALLVVICSIR